MRKTILVKGPALSRSGYGEQTRFALRALRTREDLYDIYLVNIPWGKTGFIIEDSEERAWMDHLIHKTIHFYNSGKQCMCSLQITIPNEWEAMAPVNIGYTAGIETNKVAPAWIEKANQIDKMIVISNHSKNVFLQTKYDVQNKQTGEIYKGYSCTTGIDVVGYPVRHFEPEPLDLELTTDFNFLSITQWGPRKNVDNMLKWFIEEFHDDEDVGLVLKTNLSNDSNIDRDGTTRRLENLLGNYPDKKCKIYLLHGSISEENLTWLYQHPTMRSYVSISHGEGFGLPLFEAAYNGLPIVTVLWSGHNDYLYSRNKKGKMRPMVAKVEYDIKPVQPEAVWEGVVMKDSMWAYAKERSYKQRLREVYKSPERFKSTANTLQKQILENYEQDKVFNEFCEAVWLEEWGAMEIPEAELKIRSFD